MEHHFNVNLAKEYGIEEAIILHHFYYWTVKNAVNEKHFHDGLYWTYNSRKAYSDFFTYLNETKIFRVIKHLEDEGVIIKGNYNADKWDKTNWYAITKKGLSLLKENGYDIKPFLASLQNDTIDCVKMNNRVFQNEQPIPNNNTNNNKQKNEIDKSISKKDELFEKCWLAYKRKGSKKKSKEYWDKLSNDEKQCVLPHIKAYASTRELLYQKDFERYLRDRIFNTLVIKNNSVVYDPTRKTEEKNEYLPATDGFIRWDESRKKYLYFGMFTENIVDGYSDNDRPDGATLMLNNGRGKITWNNNTKQWEKS